MSIREAYGGFYVVSWADRSGVAWVGVRRPGSLRCEWSRKGSADLGEARAWVDSELEEREKAKAAVDWLEWLEVEKKQAAAAVVVPARVRSSCAVMGFEDVPTSAKEVRMAYRRRAKEVHPDAGGSDAEMLMLKESESILIEWLGTGA